MWRVARSAAAASNLRLARPISTAIPGPCIIHKRGADVLHDPWFNKVNNAATAVRAAVTAAKGPLINWKKVSTRTYDMTEECFEVNFYGAKRMIKELLPLLQLSDSARIVNVSTSTGKLKSVNNEGAKRVLSDAKSLQERVHQVLNEFLKDYKEGLLARSRRLEFLSVCIYII